MSLICLATLVGPALTLYSAGASGADNESRFRRTVQYLQGAAPELRGEFAATALVNLAAAYRTEAAEAQAEAGAKGDASLRSWSRAVYQFTGQLPLLLDDIELGFPVSLGVDGGNPVAVTVADRTVILSHPRPGQQRAFEQEILAEYCSRHNCAAFAPLHAAREPIPMSISRVRPKWNFTTLGPVCSYQGIEVSFSSAANIASARLICEQFLQEVLLLADEISWQRRYAVAVEWDRLSIEASPRSPEHVVQLNSAGDSVLVTVPVLFRSPGLFKRMLPWIEQRLDGVHDPVLELEAAQYGWNNS